MNAGGVAPEFRARVDAPSVLLGSSSPNVKCEVFGSAYAPPPPPYIADASQRCGFEAQASEHYLQRSE
eukprot:687325-Lingulodinium_polyedra.AAC.1